MKPLSPRLLRAVIIKEFRQIRRDPLSLMFMALLPGFMLFMFGYALTLDVDNVPLMVWDQSCFCYDVKGELWQTTAARRKAFGHVLFWNPTRPDTAAPRAPRTTRCRARAVLLVHIVQRPRDEARLDVSLRRAARRAARRRLASLPVRPVTKIC